MSYRDSFISKSGALKIEGIVDKKNKKANSLQRKVNVRQEKLELVLKKSPYNYIMGRQFALIFAIIFTCIAMAGTFFCWEAEEDPIISMKYFVGCSQKPGWTAVFDEEGTLTKFEKDTPESERTVFASIPSDADKLSEDPAVLELAYQLYEIGNIGMLTADCSGYYSTGTAKSYLLDNPVGIDFELVDIRNNKTGEAFRWRSQAVNMEKTSGALGAIMAIFTPTQVERRYYKLGDEDVNYQYTGRFTKDAQGNRVADWSKKYDNSELLDRRSRMENPIPYTMAGYKGSEAQTPETLYGIGNAYYDTVGNLYGTKFDAIFGADVKNTYIPQYRDCNDYADIEGRIISYEKTDQHIFYDADGDPFFNSIKNAYVKYDEEGEFYEVKVVLNSVDGAYAAADTNWAVKDSQSAADEEASFTDIEVTFQLWDNGYFKQWNMYEHWDAPNARNMGRMYADQYYEEQFTYYAPDCDLMQKDKDGAYLYCFWK